MPETTLFLPFLPLDCIFYFSVDKGKSIQLGDCYILWQTHPPWFSLHVPWLVIFSFTHHTSLMIYPIHDLLDWFGKCFSHLWGFIIFSKLALWASMSCLLSNSIWPLKHVLFMYTMLIYNTWKIHSIYMEYSPIILHLYCVESHYSSLYFSCAYLWELSCS